MNNEKTIEPRVVHYTPGLSGRYMCGVTLVDRRTGDIEKATCQACCTQYRRKVEDNDAAYESMMFARRGWTGVVQPSWITPASKPKIH